MMKVLITGASGMVGVQLVRTLQAAGDATLRLVRSPNPGSGAHPTWDPAVGILDPAQLQGLDAVVHLAGENIAAGRWNASRKQRIRNSRVRSTALLSGALAQLEHPPQVFVCASAVGFYGDRADELLEEQSPAGSGFLSEVCQEWEAAAQAAVDAGIRTVHLRFGIILCAEEGALAQLAQPFRSGLGGRVGDGQQYMSWVTLDDSIAIIRHAVENEALRGPVNAVAPQAVRNVEFTKLLGGVLGRPARMPVPAWAVRCLFGEMGDALLLASTRAVPSALLRSGFAFQHPQLQAALQYLLR